MPTAVKTETTSELSQKMPQAAAIHLAAATALSSW